MPVSSPGNRVGGRQKGTPNKTTALLKDAILNAGEEVGDPTQGGKGGLTGYCRFLAREEPKAYSALLGRVLPTQIANEEGKSFEVSVTRVETVVIDPKGK